MNHTLEDMILHTAFIEDLGFPFKDVTTDLLLGEHKRLYQAQIRSKHPEPITICGIGWLHTLFTKLAANGFIPFSLETNYKDGDQLAPNQTLLTLTAPAAVLLRGERIALNFLRHLSAIATLTAHYVDRVKKTPLKILDTRKTTPGLRTLEKYAVQCGGGVNHRMGLYDAIMVKDTHVDILGGMEAAIEALPLAQTHGLPVIVEVRSPEELTIVLEKGNAKITRVLLDNMPPDMLRACVLKCEGKVETEASGNIRLSNILEVAQTGVKYASIGELTYGAGQVDLSMYTARI